jgi:hypothetical protein
MCRVSPKGIVKYVTDFSFVNRFLGLSQSGRLRRSVAVVRRRAQNEAAPPPN